MSTKTVVTKSKSSKGSNGIEAAPESGTQKVTKPSGTPIKTNGPPVFTDGHEMKDAKTEEERLQVIRNIFAGNGFTAEETGEYIAKMIQDMAAEHAFGGNFKTTLQTAFEMGKRLGQKDADPLAPYTGDPTKTHAVD